MRLTIPLAACLSMSAAVVPLAAQGGDVNLGAFVTVRAENVVDFEEAAADHVQWHARQNDTWTWATYSAMTGKDLRYVFVTGGHAWADFDNPGVDMAADMAHWAESGGKYTESEEFEMWVDLPDVGNAPSDPTAFPIAQVIDFEILPGGEEAVMHGIRKYKEAVGDQGTFSWARSVSRQGPPTISVIIWANSFAALGTPVPSPAEIMEEAFGSTEARQLGEAFAAGAREIESTIWVLRPDLSYIPN